MEQEQKKCFRERFLNPAALDNWRLHQHRFIVSRFNSSHDINLQKGDITAVLFQMLTCPVSSLTFLASSSNSHLEVNGDCSVLYIQYFERKNKLFKSLAL